MKVQIYWTHHSFSEFHSLQGGGWGRGKLSPAICVLKTPNEEVYTNLGLRSVVGTFVFSPNP